MVRVLFIVPYTNGSGNRTTADRIKRFIQPLVDDVTVIDALCPPSTLRETFDVAILLHAFKSGQIYLRLDLKLVIIRTVIETKRPSFSSLNRALQ